MLALGYCDFAIHAESHVTLSNGCSLELRKVYALKQGSLAKKYIKFSIRNQKKIARPQ